MVAVFSRGPYLTIPVPRLVLIMMLGPGHARLEEALVVAKSDKIAQTTICLALKTGQLGARPG